MPTVSDSPRSSSGSSRSSSTPRRSSASSRSTPPETVRVNPIRGSQTSDLSQYADPGSNAARNMGPVNFALNLFMGPSYALGSAAQGNFSGAARNLYTFGQGGPRETLGDVLQERGVLPDNAWGTGLGLGVDILTDPLTYLSFGTTAVAKTGGRAATQRLRAGIAAADEQADEIVRRAASEGRRLTQKERVDISLARAAARNGSEVRMGLTGGFRIPFTRNASMRAVIPGSASALEGAQRIGRLMSAATRADIQAGLHAGAGANKIVNAAVQDARRLATVEERAVRRQAAQLNKDIAALEGKLGLKRGEGAAGISRHLDDPENYGLPRPEFAPLAERARAMLDEFNEAERIAGITYAEVPHYVPHMVAKPTDRAKYRRVTGRTAAYMDNPSFVHPRDAQNFDQLLRLAQRGEFDVEMNIAKLIERRGEQSVRAVMKKAIDDGVFGMHGAKQPLKEVPDTAPLAQAVESETDALMQMVKPVDKTAQKDAVKESRKTVQEARRELIAAKKTGDADGVRVAQRMLANAREWQREQQAVIDAVQDVAKGTTEKAVRRAERRAAQRVQGAKRRLKNAQQRKGSPATVREAKAKLREAEDSHMKARLALENVRGRYNATPREAVAQARRLERAKRKLTAAEKKRGAIELLNERIRARAGHTLTKEEYEIARKEWREIGDAVRYHKGTLLPPEIADSLERAHRYISAAVKDETALERGRLFMQGITSRWKALALLSPGYHIRNVLDDSLRSYFFGARNPASYVQATRLLRGNGSITIKGKKYTGEEFRRILESEGVIGTGNVRAHIEPLLAQTTEGGSLLRTRRIETPGRGKLAEWSQAGGDMRENWMRTGLFIERLKAGDSFADAARTTRDALFDYGEVGEFVERARRFWAPFVTYPSKALPQMVKLSATRPGLPANIVKTQNAIEDLAGVEDYDMSALPPWMRDAILIPSTPAIRTLLGSPRDQPLILDPSRITGYATLEYTEPITAILRGEKERALPALGGIAGEMGNPFALAAMEMATDYNAFRGRQWNEGERTWAPWLVQKMEQAGIPIAGYGDKTDSFTGQQHPGYSPKLNSLFNLLPVFGQASRSIPTGREDTARLGLIKFGTGFPFTPLDIARNQYYANRFGDR